MTSRDSVHAPTEVKNIILSYPSTTQILVDSHCKILWADNSGADLGLHPTANCASGLDDADKQAVIAQQRLRSKVLGLWINNSLNTNDNHKSRDLDSAYTLNDQDYGSAMFFIIVKMVRPDTRTGGSDIKSNLENTKKSYFKHVIPKANMHISEWMN